ncbi:MAG: hypothetical protein NC548_55895 [Lachnospiraceae bacterium]|nr:hypothetical protein [Lachnospiraceae bacterium]
MGKNNVKMAAVSLSLLMLILAACGNGSGNVQEAVAPVETEADEEELTVENEPVDEEQAEEEAEPEEIEEEKEEIPIPYAEANGLEFCEELALPVEAVRVDINDSSVYEEIDAECVIKDVSIEDTEDGLKTITVQYEVTEYLYDSRSKRLLQGIMPNAVYCDLNTGEFQEFGGVLLDNGQEEKYTVEWNGETYV